MAKEAGTEARFTLKGWWLEQTPYLCPWAGEGCVIHKHGFPSSDLCLHSHFKSQQRRRILVPSSQQPLLPWPGKVRGRDLLRWGSQYKEIEKERERTNPASLLPSHLGQRCRDGSTYMPCLSTCLSHSEPCENARPQNSHGKRFSVLIGVPQSPNLISSAKRKQSCSQCPVGVGGRQGESPFTGNLSPSPGGPPFSASNSQAPRPTLGFPGGHFLNSFLELLLALGPKPPHLYSHPPQQLPSQITQGFLARSALSAHSKAPEHFLPFSPPAYAPHQSLSVAPIHFPPDRLIFAY